MAEFAGPLASRRSAEAARPPAVVAPVPAASKGALPSVAATRVAPAALQLEAPAAHDAAERQAETVARRLASRPWPSVEALGTPRAPGAGDDRSGAPLPPSLRRFLEPALGADLSAVRVHTGAEAAATANAFGADAVARGRDLWFDDGRLRSDAAAGRELLAHEVVHVLQQRAVPLARPDETIAVPAGTPQRAPRRIEVAGIRLFRTREGKTVPLPDDMSYDEAERLEAEAIAAQARLGRLPPPPRVPDVRKEAKKPPPPAPLTRGKRARRRGGFRPGAAPKPAELTAMLMASVGSSAVARHLAQRGAPVLLRGVQHLHALKTHEQTHADAQAKRGQSEQAVVVPATEEQAHSNEQQVEATAQRDVAPPNPALARRQLQDSLKANLPRSLEAVDNFRKHNRGALTSADVGLVVHADKNAVLAGYGDLKTSPPPTPTDHVTQALPVEEPAPPTPALNPGQGLVAPLPPEHSDCSGYTREADARLKEEGVTQDQLDMVTKGELAEASKGKRQLEQDAAAQPQAVQAFAQQQSAGVEKELGAQAARERQAMRAHRQAGLGKTAGRQRDAKKALEKKRDDVARDINKIHADAQKSVQRKLADLEAKSIRRFDDGNAAAAKAFEQGVEADLDAYKEDRYSGFFGKLRKFRDWLKGMDDLPRVKEIFETRRAAFVRTIDALVADISAENQRVIDACRAELKAARERIAGYVAGLEPSLQGIGKQAADEMADKLDALDRAVEAKEQALRQQLQDKQQAAIKAIDEKIEKMKEAMAGALAKLGRLLLWAAKKFFTWALGEFGYSLSDIEAIIAKGIAVLKAIFTQPIRFVKNLIKSARDGLDLFVTNFPTHLKNAVFEWLTGAMPGLELPDTWNARGIASVALQILDVSPGQLRRKLIVKLGGDESLVARLEKAFPVAKTLVTEGPLAAWQEVKPQVEELRAQAETELRNFVFVEIAKRAAVTIAAMFVPGAGIVRAIIGIYDTIVFFVQKAREIAQMVGNFLSSIAEIAAGNTAAAAKALELGLARALKLVIDFLAKFLKLSGIPGKVKGVVEKVRTKADALVDRVVDWLVAQARRLGVAVKTGAQKVAQAFTRWWAARKSFPAEDGGTHTLFFAGEETHAVLMLRSTEQTFTDFVERAATDGIKRRENAKAKAKGIAATIDAERGKAVTGADEQAAEEARKKKLTKVNGLLEDLAPHTAILFGGSLPASFAGGVNFGRDAGGFGVKMLVKPLTMKKRRAGEPPTSAANMRFDALNARRESPGGASYYVKGHLLNQSLGGPGVWDNLTPLSRKGNARHEVQGESVVKRTVDAAAIVHYEVEPRLAKRGDKADLLKAIDKTRDPLEAKREKKAIVEAEDYVPASMTVKAWLLDEKLKSIGSVIAETIANPVGRQLGDYFLATTPRPVPVDLSADDAETLATIPGIGPATAKRIIDARKRLGGRFATYAQFAAEVSGLRAEVLERLENEGHIKLFSRR